MIVSRARTVSCSSLKAPWFVKLTAAGSLAGVTKVSRILSGFKYVTADGNRRSDEILGGKCVIGGKHSTSHGDPSQTFTY